MRYNVSQRKTGCTSVARLPFATNAAMISLMEWQEAEMVSPTGFEPVTR